MKKLLTAIAGISIIVLALSPVLSNCSSPSAVSRPKVATSTSLLAYIVGQVAGDRVEVVNIIPPSQHPGNFDAKPSDVQQLADAKIFFWHKWPGEGYVPGMVEAADNPDLSLVAIEVPGNWMTPAVQTQAADKVAEALAMVDPPNADTYRRGAAEYKSAVASEEARLKQKLDAAGVSGVKAIVSFWQAGFAQWAGFNVVGTYGPPPLTPDGTKDLVDKGRENAVTLVIDNLQSDPNAGKAVADELDAGRVVLSNFPGGYEASMSWEKEIEHDVDLLLEAISQ